MSSRTVTDYFKTFRLMPDEVVLDLCTRSLVMGSEIKCVCGWALRAEIARVADRAPERIRLNYGGYAPTECAERFGGTREEWMAIYYGVLAGGELVKIENALVKRLDEIVGPVTTNEQAADDLLTSVKVERSSGNVFRDLGFDNPEEELAQAQARIRAEHGE